MGKDLDKKNRLFCDLFFGILIGSEICIPVRGLLRLHCPFESVEYIYHQANIHCVTIDQYALMFD